jgi:lysophospholipase L1-like esterase
MLVLKPGDRLAICGDSITEQKMYSRLIEDYLTMCVPQLNITVRQYGWSGEQAHGFLRRMTNDCLRFKPTIATTCYGMNDHLYRPYEDYIGASYRSNSLAIVRAFKAKGARVIQGSPGCVGKMPSWVKSANGTVDDLNVNLCNLRNIGIDIARTERVGFADVYWPMIDAGIAGQQRYGTNFLIAGNDGVHPGWAGQAMMAYAFLKSFGLYGEIGKFTVDLKHNSLKPSAGHTLVSGGTGEFAAANGEFVLMSYRYPFIGCAQAVEGEKTKPPFPGCAPEAGKETDSIRAALALTKFDEELNRLMLVVMNAKPVNYRVTWGGNSKEFTAQQLQKGINLAAEFPVNPFSGPFARVDAAVAAKQAFETKQIKQIFHGDEGKKDMDAAVTRTEQERAPLAEAIKSAFIPVMHKLRIEAIN